MPVSDVTLTLLEANRGATALVGNPTTNLVGDQVVSAATLVVIDGSSLSLRATTTNSIDPYATFDWDRDTSTGGSVNLQQTDDTEALDCVVAVDDDILSFSDGSVNPTIAFDDYNGRSVSVSTKTSGDPGNPQEEFVTLDVRCKCDGILSECPFCALLLIMNWQPYELID